MAKTITRHEGNLKGPSYEEAVAAVEKRWSIFNRAAEMTGDVLIWQGSKHSTGGNSEQIKKDFGYYQHGESESYQVYEHTSTETRERAEYERDSYYTEITEIYTPVTKTYGRGQIMKIVKRGQAKHVLKLEDEFMQRAELYYEVKAGFSTELPLKKFSILYNAFQLLSGLFLYLFLLFSSSIMPDYAQSLSADILLYNLLGDYSGVFAGIPPALCYVFFALGLVMLIAALFVSSYFKKFNAKINRFTIVHFCTTIAAFGLAYLMNDGYKDLMTSNNPIIWIPFGIFCAGRALAVIMSVIAIILSVANFITNNPHKKICDKITAKTNTLNNYIDSGEYQKDCDLLKEIKSYEVPSNSIDEIAKVLAKINEFNIQKRKLLEIQQTEFIDKSAELAELEVRLGKAQARVDALCSNK